ncbi:hypothetical protein QFC21_005772 [Naganishia friedmannii]|uniref:Uncharacterized protein n=1 Tax=Naganishia friedmannii TaxID=89922 RepID=A0ACC2V7M3_9TREE|nr:hypothetical protein QFC21_005772 [Naganishia friedmannii]
MSTTHPVPQGLPPPELAERFQSVLNGKLAMALHSNKDTADLSILEIAGIALALRARQSVDTLGELAYEPHQFLPLRVAEKLASKMDLPPTMVFDLILAYPTYLSSVHHIVDLCISRQKTLPETFGKNIIGILIRTLSAENRKVALPTKQAPPKEDAASRGRQPISRAVYTLLLVARAHHDFANVILDDSANLQVIATTYSHIEANRALSDVSKIHVKSTILLLLHTVLSTLQQTEREWKLVNMQEQERDVKGRTLRDADMVDDYLFFFVDALAAECANGKSGATGQRSTIGEVEVDILRSLATGDVNPTEMGHDNEERIESIKALFPTIPSYLLIQALSDPQFNQPISSDGSDPGVQALTNAILDNSLPKDLDKLIRAARQATGVEDAVVESVPPPPTAAPTTSRSTPATRSAAPTPPVQQAAKKPYKRDNIWNDMPMDFGKLRVENEANEASLQAALDNIPSQLRDSIIRLSEQQAEEEEAERRAELEERGARRSRAEAARISAGQGTAGRKTVPKTRVVAFEEELDDDEDALDERVRMRGLNGDSEGSDDGEAVTNHLDDGSGSEVVDLDEEPDESWIELLYIQDRAAFNRDSATRKSQKRAEMKRVTGWPDDKLEDWASLLDRNPRREQILSKHAYSRGIPNGPSSNANHSAPDHARGGRGGGRGGRGGNGEGGGRGGSRGAGRGQSKSSRGHQNATRTRGHDKKMQKAAGWT